MIKWFKIQGLGPIHELEWTPASKINVIIGQNDTGKTLLLKLLYASSVVLENYQKGDSQQTIRQLLDDKLTWTFQLKHLGDLVSKGKGSPGKLKFEGDFFHKEGAQKLQYSFTPSAGKGVGECTEKLKPIPGTTVFIPPKEVLSIARIVRKSREIDGEFGFDDTYLDLIRYLDKPATQGGKKNSSRARHKLAEYIGGKMEKGSDEKWRFRKGNTLHDIFTTAEGLKKLAIFDTLIGNKVINEGTVLLIDEPEAHLNPEGMVHFVEALAALSKIGVQLFINTHSYFIIRKLQLIARKEQWEMPVLSLERNSGVPKKGDLRQELPQNPIIDTAIKLYEQEIDLALD